MDGNVVSEKAASQLPSSPGRSVYEAGAKKAQLIQDACSRRDFHALRSLAESRGGFLRDTLRQQAWPILLGIHEGAESSASAYDAEWKELERHRDEDQVKLDVDRAFVHYPEHEDTGAEQRQKAELFNLIVSVLRTHPYLCYFQGYHDIAQVFLLVLDDNHHEDGGRNHAPLPPHQEPLTLATNPSPPSPPPATRAPLSFSSSSPSFALRAAAVARLSALRIRDFMLPTIDAAVAQLQLIPDILRASDPKLWAHLSRTQPFFALSGTLTMYAHDVTSLGEIARLFDVLLAREPVFSVYMFAAIVRSRREELFETPADEPEMLHSILSKLPPDLDLDALIAAAIRLEATHPPESLRSWHSLISSSSALKTARADAAAQTMADGRRFFDLQVQDLERAQRRRKQREMLLRSWARYRGPVRALSFALFVGVVAVCLRRWPAPITYLMSAFSRWV